MKLVMLGTGHAMVTECYNTCFALEENEKVFLVDAGGGNGILKQLKSAKINWENIQDIFVTHKHVDHIMGIVWLVRQAGQKMLRGDYQCEIRIYGHNDVILALNTMLHLLLPKKMHPLFGSKIKLIEVFDNSEYVIIDKKIRFFDIESTKEKQFGFTIEYEKNKWLTCLGDEPYHGCNYNYAKDSEWLMHEAFCLDQEKDIFKPYEKSHSTTIDAAKNATNLNVKNLIIYHTEDRNIINRKKLYGEEVKKYYKGNYFVPNDLEEIIL